MKTWTFFLFFLASIFARADLQELSGLRDLDTCGTCRGFLVPNEMGPGLFYQANYQRTGVLISVGTFRSLAVASQAEFSHVILFDFSKDVVEYNRSLVQLLRKSQSVKDFLSQIERMSQPKVLGFPVGLQSVAKLAEMAEDDIGKTFLTNPDLFLRLRRMALENRFVFVQRNLATDSTGVIAKVAETLKRSNLAVSVLDISNALDYIVEGGVTDNFIQNLQRLPFENFRVSVH